MTNLVVICLSVLFFVQNIIADNDHGENAVVFDKESFDSAVEKERLFVMFYAPW